MPVNLMKTNHDTTQPDIRNGANTDLRKSTSALADLFSYWRNLEGLSRYEAYQMARLTALSRAGVKFWNARWCAGFFIQRSIP